MSGVFAALEDLPALAVLRGLHLETAVAVGRAAVASGLRAVEITLDSPAAFDAIAALAGAVGDGAAVGAGTVVEPEDVDAAISAGATFLVAPHVDLEVLARAVAAGVPMLPGVATPSELHAAERAGASMVKLFPAAALGIPYLRALRGPYPRVPILATGGVTVEAAADWLDAGATAVGLGTATLGTRPDQVSERVTSLVRALAAR